MRPEGSASRRWGVGLGAAACVAGIAAGSGPGMVAAAAVGLVYLSTRSPFDWIRFLPAPVAVRQVTRRRCGLTRRYT